MTPFLSFLLKANLTLVLLYGVHFLCFRRDTFYGHIRRYLLIAILSAFIFPLINLSAWLSGSPAVVSVSQYVPDIEALYQYIFAQLQPENIQPQIEYAVEPIVAKAFPYGLFFWWGWLSVALFMLGKRLFQYACIVRLWRLYPRQQYGNSAIIAVDGKIQPFSFFGRIFLNPSQYSEDELNEIVTHEQIHCRQRHSIDILLSEALVCLFWFNPVAWLLRRDLKQNLEYQTDRLTLRSGLDRKRYQYNLLRVSGVTFQIVNHFLLNIHHLKKRIIMINRKKSSKIMAAKYLLVVPALAATLLVIQASGLHAPETGVANIGNESPIVTDLTVSAQTPDKPVSGAVTDADGKPLPGVSVVVKGTSTGAVTDMNGKYSLNVPDQTILKFSFAGMASQEIAVGNQQAINVVMKKDEVIVIGYGTKKRETQIKEGVDHIRIRSLGENSNPYILVDGKEFDGGINNIPPETIESISVLKDASATALYGEKAVNGVILITTKKTFDLTVRNSETLEKLHTLSVSVKGNSPLYIVDGEEIENIGDISPDQIQSIDVLKNASATAVYGEKGKNGVVLITTKKTSDKIVSGTVTDADGKTLPGVSVIVKGTTTGTVTDMNGKYSLNVPDQAVLQFSFVGMASQEIVVGNRQVINVVMVSEPPVNGEIKVHSFGLMNKGKDNTPLFIVDGKEIESLENISPNQIQSVSILKDASATAVYGEKGKNGVVLIATKSNTSETEPCKDDAIFANVENMPLFNGKIAEEGFREYIAKNVSYPAIAQENGIQGSVWVQFIIDENGTLIRAKLIRGRDALLDVEALRAVKSSPQWTPGKQNGKTVKVSYTIPLRFRLNGTAQTAPSSNKTELNDSHLLEEVVIVGFGTVRRTTVTTSVTTNTP